MLAGERVTRLRVVKVLPVDGCCFPVRRRMTRFAFRSEAPLVLILMAGDAAGR